MSEKCFCHITTANGETYVVKDKQARQEISDLTERVDNITGGGLSMSYENETLIFMKKEN